eukprot:4037308-Pleurochrysis_carterae.AAC.2
MKLAVGGERIRTQLYLESDSATRKTLAGMQASARTTDLVASCDEVEKFGNERTDESCVEVAKRRAEGGGGQSAEATGAARVHRAPIYAVTRSQRRLHGGVRCTRLLEVNTPDRRLAHDAHGQLRLD